MVTRIAFTFTDDERRAISGRRRLATRKEISEFVTRLVAVSLQRGNAALPIVGNGGSGAVDHPSLTCTTLDHLYPLGPKTASTPCYCGRRTWGGVSQSGGAR